MLDTLLSPPFAPFATAVAILCLLLLLEVVMLAVGGSLMAEPDGPDAAFEVPELEMGEIEALEVGAAAPEAFEIGDVEAEVEGVDGVAGMGWTGFGRVPFLIWFAALLTGFGITGIALQFTGPWPLWLVVPAAGAVGILFTRTFSGAFARAVPQLETASVTPRQLARRRGRVTQGTMRRGRAAEVRVTDRHGNTHYVRAEPLRDADEISRGAEVLTVWDRRADALRVVSLD
ncbi:DUF1449 family protein [Jannaschia sp. Os4]|uniref:OB-fold-containig protein n=1 Tax=Jannaschia sp. Os4 TaxID=2807617 RepID=UPI0019396356|nr:OB-fold-containig protein [Jannaschia sp. Os4]MBM2577510.1 DUF1449 family protein [Jannaschia sp. Os4]